ncbi:ribosomal protein S5 domain 2-like protein [Fomitiporia mediterranea MF3/22]|uniref:ribosomal protein S5 domain 2-like protein n=1 Tax=Fomitiporia mediterranea (strain MF3/22) TaxID=694068 RepID=UPI0004407C01|nr:ribosomal protein S5 domain 2-like protein [Fomitiporia mediterranea MF3/22]EJC99357.1 ribosomal protein S5 domain 2-like protein [Fomitiporia mediterranea MF3/22]
MNEGKDARIIIAGKKDVAVHNYPLVRRRVTQQTGKGKKHRIYSLHVVGNGDGLVGYGEGKHAEVSEANKKAFIEAVRNMDAVDRFERRTIWTDMSIKLGSTRILMRPRPVGFGLHCNPNIHQVLKAAGIKDVSAKVWGSRNPIQVVKATCMLIQAGNAPLSMGNGIGGKGKRLDAGVGMRNKESIERDHGRKLMDGRTW